VANTSGVHYDQRPGSAASTDVGRDGRSELERFVGRSRLPQSRYPPRQPILRWSRRRGCAQGHRPCSSYMPFI
jgi:hypothetical protein